MIKKWKELFSRLEKSDIQFSNFLEAGIAPGTISKLKPFISEFNKLKKTAVDFEELMIPVEPIEVRWPFDDDEMRPVWDYWKNYLTQQFGIRYGTYAEQEALEYLHRLNDGSAEQSKICLKYAMANLYPRFFKLKENETTSPNQHKTSGNKDGNPSTIEQSKDRGEELDMGRIQEGI